MGEWFKQRKAGEEEAAALKAQLNDFASGQSQNAKKVMARMGAGNDEALRAMVFQAWNEFIIQYKKDKEMNDAVKAAEQKMAGFMAKQKDGAKSVLARMQGASETGLKSSCFNGWKEICDEAKKQQYIDDMMSKKASQFGSFKD